MLLSLVAAGIGYVLLLRMPAPRFKPFKDEKAAVPPAAVVAVAASVVGSVAVAPLVESEVSEELEAAAPEE